MFDHAAPSSISASSHGSPSRSRRWLTAAVCGALVIVALPSLWDVWAVNVAGVTINHAIGEQSPDSLEDLDEAAALLESLLEKPTDSVREIPIWRTYGAALTLAPSDTGFDALWQAGQEGRLDRIGGLWLGEVASATGHWEAAEEAYARVDAANLLIHRAEQSLQAGDDALAVRGFALARSSLDAARARDLAADLLQAGTGEDPSFVTRLMRSPSERITALFEIGRGMMTAGRPDLAAPILEEALVAAENDPPGAVLEQSITLSLGLALAKSLPEDTPAVAASHSTRFYYAVDDSQSASVSAHIRIRALAHLGVDIDPTASACVQAARILLLSGDDAQASSLLRRAIGLDPLMAEAYIMLGGWYVEKGMMVQARQVYEQGAEMLPGDPRLVGARATTSYATLPPQNVLPLLEEAARMEGADPYVLAYLADCYTDLGMLSKARLTLREGLGRNPGAEPLLERLMDLSQQQGRHS